MAVSVREAKYLLAHPEILLGLAEDKIIEYKETINGVQWIPVANPAFIDGVEYRVKPEPRVKYYIERNNGFVVYTSDEEAKAVSRCNDLNDPDQPDEGGLDMYRPYRLVKFVEQL
ncbi:MAG: hypothetical protein E6Q97_03950 [Desulfurellales bacterium]|nr:MAG: hypothetical protein E6Q97_03950 [Desulfurellales bacterium]